MGQFVKVGGKGICEDDLCPGFNVVTVYAPYQYWVRKVELLKTLLYSDTALMQQGAHGPVGHQRLFLI